jgi:uncharacterized membrane protein YcgQ (UPF0703/DUF1980 family)
VEGKPVSTIELAGDLATFAGLENKLVKVEGTLVNKHGVERGNYPVLEVTSIKEIEAPKKPAS